MNNKLFYRKWFTYDGNTCNYRHFVSTIRANYVKKLDKNNNC